MKFTRFFILGLLLSSPLFAQEFNIKDFGAKENQLSTKAIQAAIDSCFSVGGGRVIVPAGNYITGTIVLKSNINLFLSPGAVLEGSIHIEDYLTGFRTHGIIYCRDAENIMISGNGKIHARGISFYDPDKNHVYDEFDKSLTRQKENYMPEGQFFTDGPIKRKPKPGMTVGFYNCSRIKLIDFTIEDTPSWAIRLADSEDINVRGLTILNNLLIPNSDGIHCTSSRNIRISDCNICAGDDAIIFTGFTLDEETPGYDHIDLSGFGYGNKSGYVENFTVTNCVLQSRSSAIRIGYGQRPIRNGSFSNITIYGSNRGIGIFAHDASNIENIIFSNISIETRLHNGQWWGNGEPIHLSAVSRFADEAVGQIRNIQFHNIIAYSEHGILLYGNKEALIEDVSFHDIFLHIKKGKECLNYGGNFDLRPAADISLQIFRHDIPGLFACYANGLQIDNFKLEWDENLPSFFSHGVECHYVNELEIRHFNGNSFPGHPEGKKIYLEQSELVN